VAHSEQSSRGGKGLFGSLKGLASTFLVLVRTRAELIAVELQEERERIKEIFVLAVLAAIFCSLGLLLLALLVVALFWDSYRWFSFSAVTLIFLALGVWALVCLYGRLRANPPILPATLSELDHDLDGLKSNEE